MKLIIYLYKKIFPMFIGAMFFFALVLNLVDLFMHIANYLQNNCSVKDIFLVMAYYTPKTLWYAVPVAMLFAVSYTLSDMYATNELEALFASGVSLFKFTYPALILSIVCSFGLFFFENKIVVQTYEKKQNLQNELLKKTVSSNNNDVIVISENGKIIYKTRKYTEANKRLQGNYFVFRDEDKQLEAVIYSQTALWNNEDCRWELDNPIEYKMINNTMEVVPVESHFTKQLTESYEIFRKKVVDVPSVNAQEAKVYINHLRKAGLPYHEQLSEYYKKYSFPFIVFLVVFLSIGLTGKTKKNVLLISLASCVSATVLFYVLMMVTMILAKHGYITPFMGAFFPVFFFMIISGILLKYSRT